MTGGLRGPRRPASFHPSEKTCFGLPDFRIPILVFSTDLLGRHESELGRDALREYGARLGQARGLQGESYAIPVRDGLDNLLPLEVIARHVGEFVAFAQTHFEDVFNVTLVGCEKGEYAPTEIGPLFAATPANCLLPHDFLPFRGWVIGLGIAATLRARSTGSDSLQETPPAEADMVAGPGEHPDAPLS